MVSLFDYLGTPAGANLGKSVAEYAKIRKAKFQRREVSNKKYTGKIMMYEKEFLDEFFQVESLFTNSSKNYTEINTQLTEDTFTAIADMELHLL